MIIKSSIINDITKLNHVFAQLAESTALQLQISLCTTKEWLTAWLKNYLTPNDKIWVCCHIIDNQVIAVYPLYLKKNTFNYELRFIGTGEAEKAEVASEFQDFIINPLYISESLELFAQQIKQLNRCVKISFEHVLPDSLCLQWLKTYKKFGWHFQKKLVGKRFRLDVLFSEEQQISQFPHTTLRRQARRFTEREDIQIKYCNTVSEITDYFNTMIELHTLQWQKRGKPGAFATHIFREFHLNYAETMLNKDQLLLFKILVQRECIAAFYGFFHQDTLYYYQSGISESSPLLNTGVAMHLIAMRHAREKQIKFYDLMSGKVNCYKIHYIEADKEVYSISYSKRWLLTVKTLINVKNTINRVIKFVLS